jgi:hypothetical protein
VAEEIARYASAHAGRYLSWRWDGKVLVLINDPEIIDREPLRARRRWSVARVS